MCVMNISLLLQESTPHLATTIQIDLEAVVELPLWWQLI